MQQKQSQIIEDIESIKPSTYQNLFLNQALCIEDFIFGHEEAIARRRLLPNTSYSSNKFGLKGYNKNKIGHFNQEELIKKTLTSKNEKKELQ